MIRPVILSRPASTARRRIRTLRASRRRRQRLGLDAGGRGSAWRRWPRLGLILRRILRRILFGRRRNAAIGYRGRRARRLLAAKAVIGARLRIGEARHEGPAENGP